ncbi:MAG: hypothetical protein ACFFG0_04360 [Candidatus Thorarchaeota archaeon]
MTDEAAKEVDAAPEEIQQESQPSNQEMNWKATREELSNLKQENERMRQQLDQMSMYQANPQQYQQPLDKQDHGLADEDLVTAADLKKFMREKEKQYQKALVETQILAKYPDYNDVVNSNIKDIATKYPGIAEAVLSSNNPNLLAYALAKARMGETVKGQQQSQEAKKIIENSQMPGSINQASTGSGSLSKANFFADMSPEEFEKHVAKVKRGGNWFT